MSHGEHEPPLPTLIGSGIDLVHTFDSQVWHYFDTLVRGVSTTTLLWRDSYDSESGEGIVRTLKSVCALLSDRRFSRHVRLISCDSRSLVFTSSHALLFAGRPVAAQQKRRSESAVDFVIVPTTAEDETQLLSRLDFMTDDWHDLLLWSLISENGNVSTQSTWEYRKNHVASRSCVGSHSQVDLSGLLEMMQSSYMHSWLPLKVIGECFGHHVWV